MCLIGGRDQWVKQWPYMHSHNDHSRGRGIRGRSTVVAICASEAMRVAVEISLSLAGYRVVTAGNAEEGLCAIAASLPELVVVQAEWPDEDVMGETVGALLVAIRAGHSSLPFLVLASADYRMSEELIEDGAVEHV